MNDRDKIAEIIREARINASPMAQLGYPEADALLDYGVIVPPCKVGDTVYVIEPCRCTTFYRNKMLNLCDEMKTKCLKIVYQKTNPYTTMNKCLKLFERPFRIEYLSKIGKTVFLTREEAEKKLEEMRGNVAKG